MLSRIIEKGTKKIGQKHYAYEVKALCWKKEKELLTLVIGPYNACASKKIIKLLSLIKKIAYYDPEISVTPSYTTEYREERIVLRGNEVALKSAVHLLRDNSYMSLATAKIALQQIGLSPPTPNEKTTLFKGHLALCPSKLR